MIALGAGSVLAWATDPSPSAGEIVFDFITGQTGLVIAGVADPITGSLAETFDNATVSAAGTYTVATAPTPDPSPSRIQYPPIPRTGGTGRNVRIRLTANLGRLTAHTGLRVEFADEELIEIL